MAELYDEVAVTDKLLYAPEDGRLLGVQGVGKQGVDIRSFHMLPEATESEKQ